MNTSVQSADVSAFYRFFAQGMRYPDRHWMTKHYFDTLFIILSELVDETETVEIQTILSSQSLPQLVEELRVEYTQLFINHYPHVIAPPFASIYMDQMFQSFFTEKTDKFYQQKQFTVSKTSVPPDHLVTELEFLAKLAEDGDFYGEEEFLCQLFRPWFHQFQDRISNTSCHCYYRVMVRLIDFFTKEDEENGI